MIRQPTERQIAAAEQLGIPVDGNTFRVISAEIGDELGRRSDAHMQKHGLAPGMRVKYVGPRRHVPRNLVISSYGKNCYVYFKGGSSFFCPTMGYSSFLSTPRPDQTPQRTRGR